MIGQESCHYDGITSYFAGIRELRKLGLVNRATARLCHTSKALNDLMKRNFDHRITPFGLRYVDFSRVLAETESIVAGSQIFQCATGEHVHGDDDDKIDIDVYVPFSQIEAVDKYLESCGYVCVAKSNKVQERKKLISHGIHYIHQTNSHRVDILAMQIDVMPRAAVAAFDFSFLMTLFDSRKYELWFPSHIISRTGRYNEVRAVLFFCFIYCTITHN